MPIQHPSLCPLCRKAETSYGITVNQAGKLSVSWWCVEKCGYEERVQINREDKKVYQEALDQLGECYGFEPGLSWPQLKARLEKEMGPGAGEEWKKGIPPVS